MDKFQSHLHEIQSKVPPMVNINVVIYKNHPDGSMFETEFLWWWKIIHENKWITPWSRMKAYEKPQEAVYRVIDKEVRWIQINLKRLITADSNDNDERSRNINLYYLCEYISGEMEYSDTFEKVQRFTLEQLKKLPNLYDQDSAILEDLEQTMNLINSNQDELLVQVDNEDKEIWYISKKIAHSSNQVHHRAAHIFLFNTKWEVILQLRSRNKASHPLRRDMHGGHQTWWQTIDQCAKAELSEEVGISWDLKFHHKKHFFKDRQSEFAYCYTIIHDGPYGFDRNEVEELWNFNCENIINGFYDTEYKILPHVKEYLIELEDIWKPLLQNKS